MKLFRRKHHPVVVIGACIAVAVLFEPLVLAVLCLGAAGLVSYQLYRTRVEQRREVVSWLMEQGFANDTLGEIATYLEGITFDEVNARREAFLAGWREGFMTPRRGVRW